jgi:transcription elongation GreA/GreB family factor
MSSKTGGKHGRALSLGERIERMEKGFIQQNQRTQMLEMLFKQVGQSFGTMRQDLSKAIDAQQFLRYVMLAMQSTLPEEEQKAINAKVTELRLTDYNAASDMDDVQNKYETIDTVEEGSVAIITSTTPDEIEDRGIFRSKSIVNEMLPEVKTALLGKKVGDKVEVTVENTRHIVEIVGVRRPPAPVDVPVEVQVEQAPVPVTLSAVPAVEEVKDAAVQ